MILKGAQGPQVCKANRDLSVNIKERNSLGSEHTQI